MQLDFVWGAIFAARVENRIAEDLPNAFIDVDSYQSRGIHHSKLAPNAWKIQLELWTSKVMVTIGEFTTRLAACEMNGDEITIL